MISDNKFPKYLCIETFDVERVGKVATGMVTAATAIKPPPIFK